MSLTSFKTILLDGIVTAHTNMHFKNLSKLVNYCTVILILKMKEDMQHFWHIMFYYYKKGKNATEITHKKDSCSVWKGAVTEGTCQKWFVKFPAGGFLLDDAPWSVDKVKLIAITLRH